MHGKWYPIHGILLKSELPYNNSMTKEQIMTVDYIIKQAVRALNDEDFDSKKELEETLEYLEKSIDHLFWDTLNGTSLQ